MTDRSSFLTPSEGCQSTAGRPAGASKPVRFAAMLRLPGLIITAVRRPVAALRKTVERMPAAIVRPLVPHRLPSTSVACSASRAARTVAT